MLEDKVDVCQTCLAIDPPRLPLREEILTQGFETVLHHTPTASVRFRADAAPSRSVISSLSSTGDGAERWRNRVRRRQSRWRNAVSYHRYVNPDEQSLASTATSFSVDRAKGKGNSGEGNENVPPGSSAHNTIRSHDVVGGRAEDESRDSPKWYRETYRGEVRPEDVNVDEDKPASDQGQTVSDRGPESRTVVPDDKQSTDHKDDTYDTDCHALVYQMVDDGCLGLLTGGGSFEGYCAGTARANREAAVSSAMYGAVAAERPTRPLVAICGRGFGSPSELRMALTRDPRMARVVARDGRLPLHAVCDSAAGVFGETDPEENNDDAPDLIDAASWTSDRERADGLREAAACLRDVVVMVLEAHPEAASMPDRAGDLPVHLLARRLWAWERRFKEKWLSDGGNNKKKHRHRDKKRYRRLFRDVNFAHRECVQLLLDGLDNRTVCRARGSVGVLLPIHVAALHGVRLPTLRRLLSAYDEGAGVVCEGALRGLEPLHAIDLLDRHRPKPRTPGVNTSIEYEVDPLALFNNASDLVFMYHPNVTPHRTDADRLRRVEAAVRTAASRRDNDTLPHAVRCAWVWMNTFRSGDRPDEDHYAASVRNVVAGLDDAAALDALLFLRLSSDETLDLLGVATPPCAAVLRSRRDELRAQRTVVVRRNNGGSVSSDHDAVVARLCRTVFRRRTDDVPVDFIVLPYRLRDAPAGGLELACRSDAEVALCFAERLLDVNSAEVMAHTLARKRDAAWREKEATIDGHVRALLATFEGRAGHVYLLDEHRGVPVLTGADGEDDVSYPFEISNPTIVLPKVLPLMQMGMTLMRGERGLVALSRVVLAEAERSGSPELVERTRKVTERVKAGDVEARSELVDIAERLYNQEGEEEDKEVTDMWKEGIVWLNILYDTFDPKRSYAGLQPVEDAKGTLLWTRPTDTTTTYEGVTEKVSSMTSDSQPEEVKEQVVVEEEGAEKTSVDPVPTDEEKNLEEAKENFSPTTEDDQAEEKKTDAHQQEGKNTKSTIENVPTNETEIIVIPSEDEEDDEEKPEPAIVQDDGPPSTAQDKIPDSEPNDRSVVDRSHAYSKAARTTLDSLALSSDGPTTAKPPQPQPETPSAKSASSLPRTVQFDPRCPGGRGAGDGDDCSFLTTGFTASQVDERSLFSLNTTDGPDTPSSKGGPAETFEDAGCRTNGEALPVLFEDGRSEEEPIDNNHKVAAVTSESLARLQREEEERHRAQEEEGHAVTTEALDRLDREEPMLIPVDDGRVKENDDDESQEGDLRAEDEWMTRWSSKESGDEPGSRGDLVLMRNASPGFRSSLTEENDEPISVALSSSTRNRSWRVSVTTENSSETRRDPRVVGLDDATEVRETESNASSAVDGMSVTRTDSDSVGKKLAQIRELERALEAFSEDEATVTRTDSDSVGRKEVQIQELEQRLAAFSEEEKILEREKKELISYLEEEIDKGTELLKTGSSFEGESTDTAAVLQKRLALVREETNEIERNNLLQRVSQLETTLSVKVTELSSLQSSLKQTDSGTVNDKDSRIAELLSLLAGKEEELRYLNADVASIEKQKGNLLMEKEKQIGQLEAALVSFTKEKKVLEKEKRELIRSFSEMLKSNCDSTVGISTTLDEEDTTRSSLRDRVAELEKIMSTKDSEIISLRSALRSKEPNPQREKDLKIAELASMLKEKEEALRHYEEAMKQSGDRK